MGSFVVIGMFSAGALVCLLIAAWLASRSYTHYKNHTLFSGSQGSSVSSLVDGETTYVTGNLDVGESTDSPLKGTFEEPRIGIGVWRLRRRRSSSKGSSRYITSAEGLVVEDFAVSDRTGDVAVDTTWTRENHYTETANNGEARSPTDSTYLYIRENRVREREKATVSITDASLDRQGFSESVVRFLQRHAPDEIGELHEYLRNKGARRRGFDFRYIEDGDDVVVAGKATVKEGEMILTGDSNTPLIIADTEPGQITKRIQKKIAFNVVFLLFVLLFAGATLFVLYLELLLA